MTASVPASTVLLHILIVLATAAVLADCSWAELLNGCDEVLENKYTLDKNVAVAREGMLELLTSDGSVVEVATQQFVDLTAVTYDQVGGHVYLSDSSHSNASIFRLNLDTSKVESLVPKQEYSVKGLAYDADSVSLFWTNGRGRTISKMKVAGGSRQPTTILTFTNEEVPMGLALDNCNKVLYWTNSNHRRPSIERASLDGSDHRVIVTENLFQPLGIAVDLPARRLYWSDDQEGIHFKIERSDLQGQDRSIVLQGTHHQPFSLSVGPDLVFWSDWIYNAVWSLPKRGGGAGGSQVEPTMMRRYRAETPMGLVANASSSCELEVTTTLADETETYMSDAAGSGAGEAASPGEDFCLHGGVLDTLTGECRCSPGHSGPRCQTQLCFNYCLHGSCYLDPRGDPQCQCQQGFKGNRCHVEERQGGGSCLECSGAEGEAAGPVRACKGDSREWRCEALGAENGTRSEAGALQACAARTQEERLVFAVFGFVVLAMGAAVGLLARQVCVLRRRPRIKKQIIVKKNVTPLTSRPNGPAGEQCEITIENCCNMNICETPCFEPQLRTSKHHSRKEEKADLLGSMEEAPLQDDLY